MVRIASVAFLKTDFKILAFLNTIGFFGNKKKPDKIWLFLFFCHSERLGSGKILSELHIHDKSLLKRVYNHAGCTKYCKYLSNDRWY